jgi:hypothetical protein
MTDTPTFGIRNALLQKQATLLAGHDSLRGMTGHGTTLGDNDEKQWVDILRGFLPERYEVGPVFAVDHHGHQSQQVDVAIYDRNFSPLWFGQKDSTSFVPVESIYAVFEAKPVLDKSYLDYARAKVASVRNLDRTTVPIPHAGGTFQAVNLESRPILGGVLAAKRGWTTVDGSAEALKKHLPALGQPDSLNIGIALDTLAFDFTPNAQAGAPTQTVNTAAVAFHTSNQLIRFAARLFRLLQSIGTVPAIDMAAYERALD